MTIACNDIWAQVRALVHPYRPFLTLDCGSTSPMFVAQDISQKAHNKQGAVGMPFTHARVRNILGAI